MEWLTFGVIPIDEGASESNFSFWLKRWINTETLFIIIITIIIIIIILIIIIIISIIIIKSKLLSGRKKKKQNTEIVKWSADVHRNVTESALVGFVLITTELCVVYSAHRSERKLLKPKKCSLVYVIKNNVSND